MRTRRDQAVDVSSFLFAVLFSVATADSVHLDAGTTPAAHVADQVAGGLGCASVFLRRRWPVQLAVALLLAGTYFHYMTGAALVALFTVAVRRPRRVTARVASVALVQFLAFLVQGTDEPPKAVGSALTYFALVAGAIGWGLYVRSRRALIASLEERAVRAAAEARRQAREEIAREMHDVLAHRLSLLSVHAGALEFNEGASAEEVRRAAGVIRGSAHQALEDLREVIGVLRAPVPYAGGDEGGDGCGDEGGRADRDGDGEGSSDGKGGAGGGDSRTADRAEDRARARAERPQPTLADVERLTAETRDAGTEVDYRRTTASPERDLPDVTGRTAYRVVQEGLTNARKHAPGAAVAVTVSGRPGEGLTVVVTNPLPEGRDAPGPPASTGIPGAGQGLIGLGERAGLAGGRLEHGPREGAFVLRAWLPWGDATAGG